MTWGLYFIDIVLVFFLTYRLLLWMRSTHSIPLIKGLCTVFIVYSLSRLLGFTTVNWVLEKLASALILIVIIIFQPELRRFLEQIGTGRFFSPFLERRERVRETPRAESFFPSLLPSSPFSEFKTGSRDWTSISDNTFLRT